MTAASVIEMLSSTIKLSREMDVAQVSPSSFSLFIIIIILHLLHY